MEFDPLTDSSMNRPYAFELDISDKSLETENRHSETLTGETFLWSELTWPEAEERLRNIPDFIQPMARKEIERLATERGQTSVTAELMDEAKEKFMKFM